MAHLAQVRGMDMMVNSSRWPKLRLWVGVHGD